MKKQIVISITLLIALFMFSSLYYAWINQTDIKHGVAFTTDTVMLNNKTNAAYVYASLFWIIAIYCLISIIRFSFDKAIESKLKPVALLKH